MSDVASRRSEYESAGLDVADLDPDPLRQWQRWYDEAVAAGVTEPNAMALATVGEDGAPDVRYRARARRRRARASPSTPTSRAPRRSSCGAHPVAAAAFGWLRAAPPGARARACRARDATPRPTPTSPRARAARASAPGPRRRASVIADRDALDALVRAIDARFPGEDVPRPERLGRLPHRARRDRVLAGPAEPAARSPALPPRRRGLGDRAPRAIERAGCSPRRRAAHRWRRPAAVRPTTPCRG